MVVIITREYFESYLFGTYERIFSGRPIAEGCFVDSWEITLLPGGLTHPDFAFDALATAARAVGDHDFVVTDVALEPPHQSNALVSWSRTDLEYVHHAATLMFDSAMFGLSARWGVYVGTTGNPSCVGGEATFMDALFGHIGGRDVAKQRFLAWAGDEWELPQQQRTNILRRVWPG